MATDWTEVYRKKLVDEKAVLEATWNVAAALTRYSIKVKEVGEATALCRYCEERLAAIDELERPKKNES